MTKHERNNWTVNIENTAATIESQLGSAVVESVFKRYGAHGTWDLMTEFESIMLAACFGISVGTVIGNFITMISSLVQIIKQRRKLNNK